MSDDSQKHLLFALLACQNELITKPQLVAAFSVWLSDRSKGLDLILVDQGSLNESQHSILGSLVDLHLAKHGNLQKSLAQLSSMDGVVQQLHSLASPYIAATLLPVFSEYATALHLPTSPIDPTVPKTTNTDDRFRIIRHHANGGLGVVHVAEDQQLRREVALKQIRTDCADSEAYRTKFIQEAEVTGQLEHPGIVPVYGLGTDATGRPYYAMRFIKGEELKTRIQSFHANRKNKSQSLDTRELRNLLRRFTDVCDAIEYAHDRGVLHRDLKPGNVMLGKHGETLVVDWGLAKPMKQAPEADPWSTVRPSVELPIQPSGSHDNSATAYGSFLGTPAYAPPEQISGELEKLCPQSDVYSLGAILYEILTSRPPVEKANSQAMLLAIHTNNQIPAPRSLDASIPKPLNAICQKAISFNIADRYATAADLKQDVERWLDDAAVKAFPEPILLKFKRWILNHQALVATASAVVLMSAIGFGLLTSVANRSNSLLNQKNGELEASQEKLIAAKDRSDHALYAQTMSVAYQKFLSGDLTTAEDMLASLPAAQRGFEWRYVEKLCRMQLNEFSGMSARPDKVGMAADGIHVWASHTRGAPQLCVWSGETDQLVSNRSQIVLAASRSGDRLAVLKSFSDTHIEIIEPVSGKLIRKIPSPPLGTRFASFGGIDDSLLAVVAVDKTLRILDVNSGTEKFNLGQPFHGTLHAFAMSPDGRTAAWRRFDNGSIEIYDIEKNKRRFSSPPQSRHPKQSYPIAFAPDGLTFAVGGYKQVELIGSRDGAQIGRLDGLSGFATALAFSPNGRLLAVTCQDNSIRVFDVVRNAELTRLTGHKIGRAYGINSVAFDASGDKMISGGEDTMVKLWDVWSGDRESLTRNGELRDDMPSPNQMVDYITDVKASIKALCASDDGSLLFVSGEDQSIRAFDAITGKIIREWKDLGLVFKSLDYDEKRKVLLAGAESYSKNSPGNLAIFDLSTGNKVEHSLVTSGLISGVRFLGDGLRLALSNNNFELNRGGLMVCNVLDGKTIWENDTPLTLVLDMAVAVDGSWIATVGAHPGVRLYDAETGKFMRSFGDEPYITLTVSDDGKRIATGGNGSWGVQLFDIERGEMLWSKLRHSGAVTDVAFADQDSRIVSTSVDGTTRIWDTQYGDLILTLDDNGEEKHTLAVSQDGGLIASAGNDPSVIVRRFSVGGRMTKIDEEQWVTLSEENFNESQLDATWNLAHGEWKTIDGALRATLMPDANQPGLWSATLFSEALVPSSVEIGYDVRIESPMIVETKFLDRTGLDSVSALHIGIPASPFNHGQKGISIYSRSAGAWLEVASRREGEFNFDVNRTYHVRTRRIGRSIKIFVDGELYGAAEVAVDPHPGFCLQALFGKQGNIAWFDNVVVKCPATSVIESKALQLVKKLYETLKVKPLIIAKLENSESDESMDMELRQTALRIIRAYRQPDEELIQLTLELCTKGEKSAEEFRTLYRHLKADILVPTEASYRAVAAAAYRAGDRAEYWDAQKLSMQLRENTVGSKHPIDVALTVLMHLEGGKLSQAQDAKRQLDQIMLAHRWQLNTAANTWKKICDDKIELPEPDPTSEKLARRVWEIDRETWMLGDIDLLSDAVAADTVLELRRNASDKKYLLTIDRDAWLATEHITRQGDKTGVQLVRRSVSVKNEAKKSTVSSHYTCELPGGFYAWVQHDTFSVQQGIDADQWKLSKRVRQAMKILDHGELFQFDLDGYDQVDQRIEQQAKNGQVKEKIHWLTIGQRPIEALEAAKSVAQNSNASSDYAMLAEVAGRAFQVEVLKKACGKAIAINPKINSPPFLRTLAVRELRTKANVFVTVPKKLREAPLELLKAADAGLAAWHASQDSLVGIFTLTSEGKLDAIADAIIQTRESQYQAKTSQRRELTVDGFPAHEFTQSGLGIGRAMGVQGRMTTQRFILVQRPQDLLMLFVSAYESAFIERNSEFQELVDDLQLKPEPNTKSSPEAGSAR